MSPTWLADWVSADMVVLALFRRGRCLPSSAPVPPRSMLGGRSRRSTWLTSSLRRRRCRDAGRSFVEGRRIRHRSASRPARRPQAIELGVAWSRLDAAHAHRQRTCLHTDTHSGGHARWAALLESQYTYTHHHLPRQNQVIQRRMPRSSRMGRPKPRSVAPCPARKKRAALRLQKAAVTSAKLLWWLKAAVKRQWQAVR